MDTRRTEVHDVQNHLIELAAFYQQSARAKARNSQTDQQHQRFGSKTSATAAGPANRDKPMRLMSATGAAAAVPARTFGPGTIMIQG